MMPKQFHLSLRRPPRAIASLFGIAGLVLLAGCGGIEEKGHPDYMAIEPITYPETTLSSAPSSGSLFVGARNVSLFTDVRAHEVGDIVSVLLVESTSAAKSADTDVAKGSNASITNPTIFGAPVTINGRYDLGVELQSNSAFEGEGSSNQSNSLQGSIAVQVSKVLPNGSLVVRGEKWIKINQGDEYIRLSGIIRSEDVSPFNTVPSTLIADARISYGGTGVLNQSNTPGWLSRFFMSPLVPF